jgi:hypothetical protein
MIQVKIEQLNDEDKILRFLDKDGLLKTLGIILPKMPRQITDMNPTFLVQSLNHYRALESHRGDKYENEIVTMHPEKGIPLSNRNLNPILVSCWSYYQSSDLSTPKIWEIFPDAVAAIESTVGSVKQIIDFIAPTSHDQRVPHEGNWGSLRADATQHGKIIYYSPQDDHKAIHENQMVAPLNCFFKRNDPYLKEREYRFMILFANHLKFSPEKFCVQLDDTSYINKIYLKSNIFNIDELRIIEAYFGHIIQLVETTETSMSL